MRYDLSSSLLFYFKDSADLRDLPSFPTRRSSNLDGRAIRLSRDGNDRSIGGSSSGAIAALLDPPIERSLDRKSTRLNSSHVKISYAVFCLKKKTKKKLDNQKQISKIQHPQTTKIH